MTTTNLVRLLLLLLTLLAVVVGVVILLTIQLEESEEGQLNKNESEKLVVVEIRRLWPPPKPCPGGRTWWVHYLYLTI